MRFTEKLSRLSMTAIVAGLSVLPALAADGADRYADKSVSVPITALTFYQNKQGLTIAEGWGDSATGAHSNYIKIAGGTGSDLHTHSQSYYGVVISGVVINESKVAGANAPLATGSYWYQTGGEAHVTKCISQSECIIFVTSKGGFDYTSVK